jgi:hypothetical protein
MDMTTHLHVSMSHVEKLADFLAVLFLPIFFPLTSLAGTIQRGLAALSAVLELLEIRRCYGSTNDTALGHDCCWSRVE